ncbi:serine/threonine-protein kinase pim-1-like [Pygocentrus nattereri]|uniref:serine/threonine-protein kinase pim-1-like n=1 Tax=Pygocentrus nattereri TaxID=42514 RepID=UPI001891CA3F|nr:serine/threonine-protein kinase pim-1-like [Pygocentrus nattereri]
MRSHRRFCSLNARPEDLSCQRERDFQGEPNRIQHMRRLFACCCPNAWSLIACGRTVGCHGFADVKHESNAFTLQRKILPVELKVVPVEVALLQIMNQPPICNAIIQLIEWFDEPDRYILILERPDPCKSLDSFLQDYGGYVTEDMARDIMWQSVAAAFQCSKRGVMHRDIKLENLLINPHTLAVKLIDFGCGDLIKKSGYDIFEGTTEYFPPEFFLKGRYHAGPATVWSLCVLMFRMVCGYLPFAEDDITSGALHFRDGLSNECCDLIRWCLQRNPTIRLNLQKLQ